MSEQANPEQSDSLRSLNTIVITNEQLFSVRDAMRELNRIVAKLESGELDQAVLMRKSRMVAVIRPVTEFGRRS